MGLLRDVFSNLGISPELILEAVLYLIAVLLSAISALRAFRALVRALKTLLLSFEKGRYWDIGFTLRSWPDQKRESPESGETQGVLDLAHQLQQYSTASAKLAKPSYAFQRFGEELRALRRSRKLKQDELADAVDVSCGYISDLELGAIVPQYSVLHKIVSVLRLTDKELARLILVMKDS